MIRLLPITAIVMLFISSCSNKTADDILNASIEHHDPANEWVSFSHSFYFKSNFTPDDTLSEQLVVALDVPKNTFTYINRTKDIIAQLNGDSCEILKGETPCEGINWTKNFYTYVWGLPMKLKDPATVLDQKVVDTTFNTINCHRLHVDYGNHDWYYYISTTDYALIGFAFTNRDNDNKEYVTLEGSYEIDGIRFPKKRSWYDTESKKLLGTNELIKHQ